MTYKTNKVTATITNNYLLKIDEQEISPKIIDTLTKSIIENSSPYVVYSIKSRSFFYISNGCIAKLQITNPEKTSEFLHSQIINLGSVKTIQEFHARCKTLFFNNIYMMFIEDSQKSFIFSPCFKHKFLAINL